MRVTIFFILAPGPSQIESITYRVGTDDPVDALKKSLTQARQATTVGIDHITIENEPAT